MFFYNSSFVASIGVAPCQIMNGRLPWWPFDLKLLAPKPISIHQLQATLQLAKKYVVKTFQHSQKNLKRRFDTGRQQPRYYPNQIVQIYHKKASPFGLTKFLYEKGRIVCKISKSVYRVKVRSRGKSKILPIHIRHIKPFFVRPKY